MSIFVLNEGCEILLDRINSNIVDMYTVRNLCYHTLSTKCFETQPINIIYIRLSITNCHICYNYFLDL
jgi:hypothetical protein